MTDDHKISGVRGAGNAAERARIQQVKAAEQELVSDIRQDSSNSEFQEWCETSAFNPLAIARRFETIEKRIKRPDKEESTEEIDEIVEAIDSVEKIAEEFTQKNPELKTRTLLSLLSQLSSKDSPEQIIAKLLANYPDQSLADEALNYLIKVTDPESQLGLNLKEAKKLLLKEYEREIIAGRNINSQAQEFSKEGIGSPTTLRDLYRDITGNPRDPVTLFEELNNMFTFDKLKVALKFILHSIGTDLKAKGPSIPKGELQRLFSEARTMQAILGIYRFFNSRMDMIDNLFKKENLILPKRLTFELLAQLFVKILQEKYPSPDKILRMANLLGINEEITAQIIIFSQYRDAMRGVSPRLFQTLKHRQDLLMTFIETISELDDLLEEDDEKLEEKESENNR
jgi:type III secretion protein W